MNIAIIVAAGSGKRFGGSTPKQFLSVCGKPLVVHTLECFEECRRIDRTVLVLPPEHTDDFNAKLLFPYKLSKLYKTVGGGPTRTDSVLLGLTAIGSEKPEIVAVHDGARPLVRSADIEKTIRQAEKFGAACLVGEVTDTIKEVSGGQIVRTIDRKSLRRALTPQCFRYEILRRAFHHRRPDQPATDESSLVERIGVAVKTVEGSPENIKVTRPEDLLFVENFLKNKSRCSESDLEAISTNSPRAAR